MSHWSWDHFFSDGSLYRNNNSNKNAWCIQCLSHQTELIRHKVRKTTVVGMDIKRTHIEGGLVRVRGHRNFEAPTSDGDGCEIDTDENDLGDVLDFDKLAEELINNATADLSDTDDDELAVAPPPLTIRLPLHAIQSTLPVPPPQQKTAIPLKSLFIFPGDQDAPSGGPGMDYFWQGGIKNLDKEMELYEILHSNSEAGKTDTTATSTDVPMASADMMT